MKLTSTLHKVSSLLLIISLLLITSACEEGSAPLFAESNAYQVDPLFREFYDFLGGMSVLGPAISPLFPHNQAKYQYTSTALMVYDPQAPAYQRFHLAALGLDMGLAEPPVAPPAGADSRRYLDGHLIFEDFMALFERLGGARYAGRPITEVHYNPDTRRYEQHFENLGIYRLEGDPAGTGRLLAYGSWKCSASCRQIPLTSNMVLVPPKVDSLFADAVSRLGTDFTGFAITDPYTAADGLFEQVFENLVLVHDPANPGQVVLRPISRQLGILPDPLAAASAEPGMVFYAIQDGQGYNVLQSFMDYLAPRGGMEASGPPLGELSRIGSGVYRQCFENVCLEEHRKPSGSVWVRPAPLGYQYRAMVVKGSAGLQPAPQPGPQLEIEVQPTAQPAAEVQPPTAQPPDGADAVADPQVLPPAREAPLPTPTAQPPASNAIGGGGLSELSIQVWEMFPMVTPDQGQEIGVVVFENGQPLSRIEPDLILTLPDGRNKTYYLYPTGADGQTRMRIDPVSAANGTLIPYQVCVINRRGVKFCVKDSFLIWETP